MWSTGVTIELVVAHPETISIGIGILKMRIQHIVLIRFKMPTETIYTEGFCIIDIRTGTNKRFSPVKRRSISSSICVKE